MKRFIFFARVCILLFSVFPLAAPAQHADAFPNYVVIGAFAHQANAVNFVKDATDHQFPAEFQMNHNRNLYYVYVLTTHERAVATAQAVKLRAETKYFDTWVYSGPLGAAAFSDGVNSAGQDIDPVTGKSIESIGTGEEGGGAPHEAAVTMKRGDGYTRSAAADAEASVAETKVAVGAEADEKKADSGGNIVNEIPAPVRVSIQPLTGEEIVDKNLYFHLFRADNRKVVAGEVEAIDFERSRKMATYPANASVTVRLPSTDSRRISFICQVFGYRRQQVEFTPSQPSPELYLDDKGNLVVPFELMRLQKGDIAIMYNVFFYKDAAVMRPESRYEVNNLLELLNENPDYKIVIHGHTNGNAGGKIIRMGVPGNFYSLSGTEQGYGSARKLSEERAMVIRDYLVSTGVSADRMEVKAWGGKRPIHDKHSARAHENVRVEIEILSE